MKIGLGVTVLARGIVAGGIDGIGHHTQELYRRFGDSKRQVVPVSFGYSLGEDEEQNRVELHRFAPLVALAQTTGLPFWVVGQLKGKIDLFHAPDHHIPNFGDIPVVATIHDAIPLAYPQWVPWRYRWMISPAFRRSARWAERVITVSHYSKMQIADHFGIPPEKITVIPNGVDGRWFLPVDKERLNVLCNRYCLHRKYIISVGTLQPRKNFERLIQAYQTLPVAMRDEFDLILVGRKGWGCENLLQILLDAQGKSNIKWLEYLPDFDLETLLKGAQCMVFPSLAEGFGLPVIEAFAAGVPVVTSNITSLPEVAGDAALLVDPSEVDEIANGIKTVLEDRELASDLVLLGRERAEHYSWNRVAEETVSLYQSVI